MGGLPAISDATQILDRAPVKHPNQDWRTRIFQLAEALFQSIGMQLSVERYQAIAVDRGASLDTLDYPLNNRRWLAGTVRQVRKLTPTPEVSRSMDGNPRNGLTPGPGGFYDDVGNITCQPHLRAALGLTKTRAASNPRGWISRRTWWWTSRTKTPGWRGVCPGWITPSRV